MHEDIITTDVLVIGAGIAGAFAAIRAKEQGADVVLLTKGIFGKDGASTWMAGPGFQVALYPPDSPEVQAKDTIKAGHYLNDQQIVYECVRIIPEVFDRLCRWGVRFRQTDGKFFMRRLPGETYPRVPALERPGEYAGHEYKRALTKQVRRLAVRTMDDICAVELLSNQGSIVGVVGLDIREGAPKVFRAKSTILTTGGHIGCYSATLAPTATGDGCAIAYRAGAEIADMEFADFYTYVAVWPPAFRGDDWPAELVYNLGAMMYNRVGDEFRKRYSGALRNPPLAAASELKAGRGSPHDGVYLSLRHLPANLVKDFLTSVGHQKWLDKVNQAGFDLCNEAIEIAPSGITSFGGCKVNEKCETSLDGLYAAGEVAAGKEGAYTMAGNSIPLCGAMGYIAGDQAATRAKNSNLPELDTNQVNAISERMTEPLKKEKGYKPFEAKKRVQGILDKYAGLVGRTDKGLREGLSEIEKFREEVLTNIHIASASRRFNLGWMQALETINVTDVAELILRSALERTESRGLHFREDYPEENPEWLKRVIIRQTNGKAIITLEPVTFTHVEPPTKAD